MRNPLHIWRILNGPCKDMTALISRSMDERLGFWERFGYKLHLLYCRACRRYRNQLHTLRAVLRGAAEQALAQTTEAQSEPAASAPDAGATRSADAGAALSPEAKKRIRSALKV